MLQPSLLELPSTGYAQPPGVMLGLCFMLTLRADLSTLRGAQLSGAEN